MFSSLFHCSIVPLGNQTLFSINLLCLSDHQVKVPSYKDESTQQQGLPYLVGADGGQQILIGEMPISLCIVTILWHPLMDSEKELARVTI